MRLPPDDTLTSEVNQYRRSFTAAKAESSYTAVCLIGAKKAVPAYFGDNRGVRPVRIAATRDPKKIARLSDSENAVSEIIVLESVWVRTEAHAKRLKAELDDLLLGLADGEGLRHSWRNIGHDADVQVTWGVLLKNALENLWARREVVETFDDRERVRRIALDSRKTMGRV